MTQAYNLGQFGNKVNTSGQANLTTAVTGTLPIANGGTNNGSLAVTAGGVVYTDGSKLVNVGAGTSGQLLQSNAGSAPSWVTLSVAGGLKNTIYYTASGTYTKATNNPTFIIVEVVGSGGVSTSTYSVTPNGGTSSFGTFCSATGGNGFSYSSASGGSGSGGDINMTGATGSLHGLTTGGYNFGYLVTAQAAGPVYVSYGSGGQGTQYVGTNSYVTQVGGGAGGYARKKILASALASSETITIGTTGMSNGLVVVWEYS
ncbi:hypothetical protein EB001_08080 [bacterium]|nr:hypothetical protein [bacterium]